MPLTFITILKKCMYKYSILTLEWQRCCFINISDLQNPNLNFSKHIYMGKEQMKKKKAISNKKVAKLMQKLGRCRWWTWKTLYQVIKCEWRLQTLGFSGIWLKCLITEVISAQVYFGFSNPPGNSLRAARFADFLLHWDIPACSGIVMSVASWSALEQGVCLWV